MSLFDEIQSKYLEARKKQDKFLSIVLGMLVSDLKYEKINKQKELEDGDVIALIQKNIKQKKEALEEFRKAGRSELVENAEKELDLLVSFLPAMMSDSEIEDIVKNVISEVSAGPSDVGKVMKEVMTRVKGRADGSKVKEMVSRSLQGK